MAIQAWLCKCYARLEAWRCLATHFQMMKAAMTSLHCWLGLWTPATPLTLPAGNQSSSSLNHLSCCSSCMEAVLGGCKLFFPQEQQATIMFMAFAAHLYAEPKLRASVGAKLEQPLTNKAQYHSHRRQLVRNALLSDTCKGERRVGSTTFLRPQMHMYLLASRPACINSTSQ